VHDLLAMRYLGERRRKPIQSEQDMQTQAMEITSMLGAPARPIDDRTRALAAYAQETIHKLRRRSNGR